MVLLFFLAFWTGFLIWFVCRQERRYLRYGTFWMALAGLLAFHVAAFVVILRSYPEWRPVWFMFVVIIEAPLMTTAVEAVVRMNRPR
ncbi:MAG: hypothetical protein WCB11_22830 [Terriglobales bacterium]